MEPQQPHAVYPHWLFPVVLVVVAVFAVFAGAAGTTVYFVTHPQVSTVISSTTNTVSRTETSTTSITSTVTSSTTSTATLTPQNPYLNYGNPYPYQNQYGNQVSMTGIVYNQGNGCIYLQTNGNYYALSGNVPSNVYTNQQLTVYGYFDGTSSQCGAPTFIVTSSY
jgi:hypothetical protein